MIYDSRLGLLDIEALSIKGDLEKEEKEKVIAYMEPLMKIATDRIIINLDSYDFYFNKLLKSKNIKTQNEVLTKEVVIANWLVCIRIYRIY